MKKMYTLLTLLALSMAFVKTSHATEVIDDPNNPIPDYCNEPIVEGSTYDYSVCTTDSNTSVETVTPPDYCATDFIGPLSLDQIEACVTYYLAYPPSSDTLSLADQSQYTRIEKIDGIWYGVIDVSDIHVESSYVAKDYYVSSVGISFTRDTQDLKQIELDYTTVQNSCTGYLIFDNYCMGSREDSYSDTLVISNTSNEDNWLSLLQGDYIHVGDEYDYMLLLTGPEMESVTVVKFTYVLTDLEVDDLRLDIQEQYEIEKAIILNNPLLTDDEKFLLVIALMEEYLEYEIDYGEELTSICIGDQCTAINEDTTGDLPGFDPTDPFANMPDWASGALEATIKIIISVVAALFSGVFITVIAWFIAKKVLETTGSVAIGTTKITVASSSWWAKIFGTGLLEIFHTIKLGFLALPIWAKLIFIMIIISSTSLLFI
ncbi:MAG: hypothetical protein KQ78_00833 [Candidatus Izimaplasma bacterium HR2]|nr:MAG: hypothetical protein KQ78_00833 [Candidatus Izimaplasma bacterium HR2]